MKTTLLLVGLTQGVIAGSPVSQVEVTTTAVVPGPTPYRTLKGAFDALNAGTHQGAVTVTINQDTVETATASLNASATGAANYASVLVQPAGGLRSITGSIAGAVIRLNGADNVTIDGRIGGAGRNLTVSNNNDSFSYTVSDGQGHTATGTISVMIVNPAGASLSVTRNGFGQMLIQFAGISPGTILLCRLKAQSSKS